MKNLFIFLLILIVGEVQAQNFCGTPKDTQVKSRFERYRNISIERNNTLYLPLSIHIVRRSDGTGGIKTTQAYYDLCILNQDFSSTGLQFYIENLVEINNSDYYAHDFTMGYTMIQNENIPNTLNCYYVADAAGNCGYYFPGVDGVVLSMSCMGFGNHTWAHEMGHMLSLPHTFYGWEDSTNIPVSERENVSGSNCTSTGDYICDTPPDYISYRWTCGANGFSANSFTDPEGTTFKVDGTNFMSYSNDGCMLKFTPNQADNMLSNVNIDRTELSHNLPTTPITDTAQLLSPAIDEITSTQNIGDILFSWKSVQNTEKYLLRISRISSFSDNYFDTITHDTSYLYTRLIPNNRTFYWRVFPLNKATTCAPQSTGRFIHTTTTTGFNDITDLNNNVQVFPNPIGNSQEIFIENAYRKGIELVELYSSTGKLIHSKEYNENQRSITFDMQNIAQGLYYLKIHIEGNSITKKIVK